MTYQRMRSGRLRFGVTSIRNLALQSTCDGVINRIAQNLTIAEMRSCTNALLQGYTSRRTAEFTIQAQRQTDNAQAVNAIPCPLCSLVLLVAVERHPFKSSPAGMRPPA